MHVFDNGSIAYLPFIQRLQYDALFIPVWRRMGILMSELVNEDIPLWEKKDNQEDGDFQEYVFIRMITVSLWGGLSRRRK